jgi:TonB family protein
VDFRKITPLVAPPVELTQTAPNKGKVSHEMDLQGLLAKPPVTAPSSPPTSTRPAAPVEEATPRPRPIAPPVPLPEPPKLESAPVGATELAANLTPKLAPLAPPQIQSEERPKLAFEKPGAPVLAAPQARIPTPPRSSVEEVVKRSGRSPSAGGIVVGDLGEGVGGLGEALNLPPSPGKNASAVELLSDPMGADFRPYLIRILSAVRRNWHAVIPESARLGQRGRVLIQFAINRDGSVPKLVIALPSGSDPLDRAAVAGISASNPFPPLPPEFRGQQVRLQLTFSYNLPSR